MSGRFISFEGGEGSGKSTQIKRLAERLRLIGEDVVTTREPGGTPGADEIRALVLNGATDRWTPMTELLLMNAARCQHVAEVVRPALARGAWVLSDRYADSSYVYQGAVQGIGRETLDAVHFAATGGLWPDLTLLFDCPAEFGLSRTSDRGAHETRFEAHGAGFHKKVRAAFLARAEAEPQRFRVMDARGTPDEVAEAVWAEIRPSLSREG